jgi:hypothetical protein
MFEIGAMIPDKQLEFISGGMKQVSASGPMPGNRELILPKIDQAFLREHPLIQCPATTFNPGSMSSAPFPVRLQGSGSGDSMSIFTKVDDGSKNIGILANNCNGRTRYSVQIGFKF